MEVDEERKESVTMQIDTTEAGLNRAVQQKKADDSKVESEKKRSASLKLALMLIGTMRLVSPLIRVHFLKGLLQQEDFFKTKGSTVIQKQSEHNAKMGKELQPPLVVILRATETVKCNLLEQEKQLAEAVASGSADTQARKDLLKEVQKVRALLRNLNLLILDVFKDFDSVIEKTLSAQDKAAKDNKASQEKQLTIS